MEKPIDLFKAIFEDDSGDEDEGAGEELGSAGGKSGQGLAAPPMADSQPGSAMRGATVQPAAHAERLLSQPTPPQQISARLPDMPKVRPPVGLARDLGLLPFCAAMDVDGSQIAK